MRRCAIAVLVLSVAGCFSKPGFQGAADAARGDGNGSGGSLVGVTVVGDGMNEDLTVTAPDLVLNFPGTGIHLPDQLKIGGVNVLGEQDGCGYENRTGIALYPIYSVSVGQTWPIEAGDSVTSTIERLASGPAFAQVNVSWSGLFHCTASTRTAAGNSTFTIFPDGRIIRDDHIEPPTSTMVGGSACGCSTATSNYFLTSYVTLDNLHFTHLAYDATPSTTPMVTDVALSTLMDNNGVESPNPRWACLENRNASAQRRMGVAWPVVSPSANNDGTRIKLEIDSPTPDQTTLLYDWVNDSANVPTTRRDLQVAWFADTGANATCTASTMGALFDGFARPRRLEVDRGAGAAPVSLDPHTGIYTVGGPPAQSYTARVEDGVTGVPAGFAISLPFATDVTPVVTRGGTPLVVNEDFLVQTAGSPVVHTLWFPTALAPQTTLVIAQP